MSISFFRHYAALVCYYRSSYRVTNRFIENVKALKYLLQHYSLVWALAFSTIWPQISFSCALLYHPLTRILLRSSLTSWNHLLRGLPRLPTPKVLLYIMILGILLSSILCTCPSYANHCDLINLTISSCCSILFISLLFLLQMSPIFFGL